MKRAYLISLHVAALDTNPECKCFVEWDDATEWIQSMRGNDTDESELPLIHCEEFGADIHDSLWRLDFLGAHFKGLCNGKYEFELRGVPVSHESFPDLVALACREWLHPA